MKKIKLNKLEVQNSALTREQLKGVMGGSGSGSISYDPCDGKAIASTCIYSIRNDITIYGTCRYLATSPNKLVCYYED